MKNKTCLAWILAAAALSLSACAANHVDRATLTGPEPSWASSNSGVYGQGDARKFDGVGLFKAEAKVNILTQGADDAAQAAIAGVVNDYLDILTVELNVPPVAPTSAPAAASAVVVAASSATVVIPSAAALAPVVVASAPIASPVSVSSVPASAAISTATASPVTASSAPVSVSSSSLSVLAPALELATPGAQTFAPLTDDAVSAVRQAAVAVLKAQARIEQRWLGHSHAAALCVLNFSEFKKDLAASPGLPTGAAAYLSLNVDEAFSRLQSRQKGGAAAGNSAAPIP